MLIKIIIGLLAGIPLSLVTDWYCALMAIESEDETEKNTKFDSGARFRHYVHESMRNRTITTMVVTAVGFGVIDRYVFGWLDFTIVSILFMVLLVVALVDLRTFLIPDSILVVGTIVGLPLLLWSQGWEWLMPAAAGALTGGGILLLIVVITRGGMGGGDVKMSAFMGVFLGFQGILTAFFIAFITGGIYGVFLILSGKKKKGDEIPFGPFLALGGIIAAIASQSIFQWYISLLMG